MTNRTYSPQERVNQAWSILSGLPIDEMLNPWDETDTDWECEVCLDAYLRLIYERHQRCRPDHQPSSFPDTVEQFNQTYPLTPDFSGNLRKSLSI